MAAHTAILQCIIWFSEDIVMYLYLFLLQVDNRYVLRYRITGDVYVGRNKIGDMIKQGIDNS